MTDIELGKFLSFVLRHHPERIGLQLDQEGYASVQELIEKVNNTEKYRGELTNKRLQHIVETNDKKRYSYNSDGTKIRAVQGHSFHVDVAKKAIPPAVLYHGTSSAAYTLIRKQGLRKMNRDYVHLSSNIETAQAVGLRHAKRDSDVVILKINATKMLADGYTFYIAENGVWLCDHIPAKYLTVV